MKKTPFLLLVLIVLSLSTGVQADDNPRLWILSGQSNACGRAKLPGPNPVPAVQAFDLKSGRFVVAVDPLPGMNTAGVGPWVAAAQTVAKSGVDIRLVGSATGGRPISFWHRGQVGDKELMTSIDKAARGAGVFLWSQGESDALDGVTRSEYVDELKQLVARVRTQAGNADMLTVIVQIGADTRTGWSGYMTIREAQRQFVMQDKRAILVPGLGRTLKDSVHLDNAGYRELGKEIGRAVLRHRFANSQGSWPGPVLDAAVLKKNRTSLTVHFAEANQLAGCNAADFAVIDAEGTVRCKAAESGKTVATLEFERTICLPARIIYGYGQSPRASLTDEAGNRAPGVQFKITIGETIEDHPTKAPNGAGRTEK